MPALILIGYWKSFDFWVVSFVALSGGLLGILFMIPMRRVFVVDNEDLPYPEGVACAAVLGSRRQRTCRPSCCDQLDCRRRAWIAVQDRERA